MVIAGQRCELYLKSEHSAPVACSVKMRGDPVGLLSDLRSVNRASDFARAMAKQGGLFETNCSPEQVLAALKASHFEVTEETPTSLSGKPEFKYHNGESPVITAHVSAGSMLPTLVTIKVQLNAGPGEANPAILKNPATIPSLTGLMIKVSKIDPKWQPI